MGFQFRYKIEVNGLLCTCSLEEIICTYQNTITSTNHPHFMLCQDHELSQQYSKVTDSMFHTISKKTHIPVI